MKRYIVAMVVWLSIAMLTWADFDIDPDCRVDNRGSGYCAWCNLEMLGRQYGIKQLHGLVDRRTKLRFWNTKKQAYTEDGSAYVTDLAVELDKLKLRYKLQRHGSQDIAIVKDACAANLGCIASVLNYPATGDSHSILVTGWPIADNGDVNFLDCNALWSATPSGRQIPQSRLCGIEWFKRHWTGAALVLYPPTKQEVIYVARRQLRPFRPDYPFAYNGFIYQSKDAAAPPGRPR